MVPWNCSQVWWARIPRARGMNWSCYLTTCQLPENFRTKFGEFSPKDCPNTCNTMFAKICHMKQKSGKIWEERCFIESHLPKKIERLDCFPPRSIERWNSDLCGSRLKAIGCNGRLMRSPGKIQTPSLKQPNKNLKMDGWKMIRSFRVGFGLFSGRVSLTKIIKNQMWHCRL